MKRTTTLALIMVTALFLAACDNNTPSTRAKEDPRDAIIKHAIKTVAATSNPVEIAALFAGHPDMAKASGVAEKMVLTGLIIGNINGFDLALDRARDIKLKPSGSSEKHYCLDGIFSYTGPGRTGGGKIEIENGTGTILACTRTGKDGALYLDKLVFKPDGRTLQAAKKVARTGGK